MSHWAEIDADNKVLRVVVGDNNDPNGDEGYQWLIDNLGGTWIKTSYNAKIRGKYAGIGDLYDEVKDEFISTMEHLTEIPQQAALSTPMVTVDETEAI